MAFDVVVTSIGSSHKSLVNLDSGIVVSRLRTVAVTYSAGHRILRRDFVPPSTKKVAGSPKTARGGSNLQFPVDPGGTKDASGEVLPDRKGIENGLEK
jgi:hypothetical protein